MTDKTEWELIDEPASGSRQSHAWQHDDARQFGQSQDARQSAQAPQGRAAMAQAILGPHWKFKVAGMVSVAIVVIVLFAMLTGIIFVAVAGFALLSFGFSQLRRLLHGGRGSSSASHSERARPGDWKNLR